jgi:hypothetical protein
MPRMSARLRGRDHLFFAATGFHAEQPLGVGEEARVSLFRNNPPLGGKDGSNESRQSPKSVTIPYQRLMRAVLVARVRNFKQSYETNVLLDCFKQVFKYWA